MAAGTLQGYICWREDCFHLDKGKSISIAFPVLSSFFVICLGGLQKSGFLLDLIAMHLSQNGHRATNLDSNT